MGIETGYVAGELLPPPLGWDAWVAIGTMALAFVTAIAVVLPLVTEKMRRTDRAARFAILLDHELVMLYGMMINRADETAPAKRTVANAPHAIDIFFESYKTLGLPLLEKLIDQIEVFPTSVAARLGGVLSFVMQAQRNQPPQLPNSGPILFADVITVLATAYDESVVLAIRARQAIEAMRPLASKFVTLPALGEIPSHIQSRYDEVVSRTRGTPMVVP